MLKTSIIGQRNDITQVMDSYRPFASTCLTSEAKFEQPQYEGSKFNAHFLGWHNPGMLGRFKGSHFIGYLYSKVVQTFRKQECITILSV